MRKIALLSASLGAMLVSLLPPTLAHAAPTTYVSGTGSGTTCSRASPCGDFQTAHDATDAGGELICLDTIVQVGPLTINKRIIVDCEYVYGLIVALSGGNAIDINTSGTVAIRGLEIRGNGSGSKGINFLSGTALYLFRTRIYGFGGGNGIGLFVAPSTGTSDIVVQTVAIDSNGLAASGGGIFIHPTGSGSVKAVLNDVRVRRNTFGVVVDGTDTTGSMVVQLSESLVALNTGNGIQVTTKGGIVVDHTRSTENAGYGIFAQGSGSLVNLGNSTVAANGAGLGTASGGQILSYGNNQTKGNSFDGAPTGMLPLN